MTIGRVVTPKSWRTRGLDAWFSSLSNGAIDPSIGPGELRLIEGPHDPCAASMAAHKSEYQAHIQSIMSKNFGASGGAPQAGGPARRSRPDGATWREIARSREIFQQYPSTLVRSGGPTNPS